MKRKQKQIWEQEHLGSVSLPSLGKTHPAKGVVDFSNFLKKFNLSGKRIVDIGSGKGRNAIYLAAEGYEVYCIDYIQTALDHTKKLAKKMNLSSHVHIINAEIDKSWPFEDNFFDLAIDCFSSIDVETKKGRLRYRDELWRTLKPGGSALIMVVSVNDEMESKFLKESPGREKNSVIWPNGKFQKNYNERELRSFYVMFETLKLKEISKKAFKLGTAYTAKNYWMVLRKPL